MTPTPPTPPAPPASASPIGSLPPAITAITGEIHDRYWDLPAEITKRKREHYNAYMREYMRTEYAPTKKRVNLTLTLQEHKRLQKAAKKSGRKLAPFIREAVLAALEQRYLVPADTQQQLDDAIIQLRKIGTNINQLAHHANAKQHTTAEDLRLIRQALTRMEHALKKTITEPPRRE